MLASGNHAGRTLAAFSHPAAVTQMRIRKSLDPGAHHKVSAIGYVVRERTSVLMKNNGWHEAA